MTMTSKEHQALGDAVSQLMVATGALQRAAKLLAEAGGPEEQAEAKHMGEAAQALARKAADAYVAHAMVEAES